MRQAVTETELLALVLAAEKSGSSLEEVMEQEKIISSQEFNNVKAAIAQVPAWEWEKKRFDASILNLLPAKIRQHYKAAAIGLNGRQIKIALVNPQDFLAHEALEKFAEKRGWQAKYYSLSAADFRALDGLAAATADTAEDFFPPQHQACRHAPTHDSDHNDKSLDRLLELIVDYAIAGGALAVHLEGDKQQGRVRYRAGKKLHHSLSYPASVHRGLIARLENLIGGRQGRCRFKCADRDFCLTATILPYEHGDKAVLSAVDLSVAPKRLRYQGFSLKQLELARLALVQSGIIVVAANDSLTRLETLYGLVSEIDARAVNIVTVESAPAQRLPGVNQYVINPLKRSWSESLATVLDQDPDVIMLEEIDAKSLDLAARAAERGKVVILAISASSLDQALRQIWQQAADPEAFFKRLTLAIGVKKVKRLCQKCRQSARLPHSLAKHAAQEIAKTPAEFLGETWPGLRFYHSSGCAACGQTGAFGGALLAELRPYSPAARNELISALRSSGRDLSPADIKCATIIQDGLIKASYGLISGQEALSGY